MAISCSTSQRMLIPSPFSDDHNLRLLKMLGRFRLAKRPRGHEEKEADSEMLYINP